MVQRIKEFGSALIFRKLHSENEIFKILSLSATICGLEKKKKAE